jgi:hypothetical protein
MEPEYKHCLFFRQFNELTSAENLTTEEKAIHTIGHLLNLQRHVCYLSAVEFHLAFTLLILLPCTVLIILTIRIIKGIYFSITPQPTYVCLQLSTCHNMISVVLKSLDNCPAQLNFQALELSSVIELSCHNYFQFALSVPDMQIFYHAIMGDGEACMVPTTVRIPCYKFLALRRIINRRFRMDVVLQHRKVTYKLNTVESCILGDHD